jgi:hypothetical protein
VRGSRGKGARCRFFDGTRQPHRGPAMSNRNDGNGAERPLAHGASWSDVWAGLLLTIGLLGSATLVALHFSGRPSSMFKEQKHAASHAKYLVGIRDPSRPGWRGTDRPWNLMGTHEIAADIEDRGRGEPTVERGRGEGEATIETSSIDIWAWP